MTRDHRITNHLEISPRVYSCYRTGQEERRQGWGRYKPARWIFVAWRDPDWVPGEPSEVFHHYRISHN